MAASLGPASLSVTVAGVVTTNAFVVVAAAGSYHGIREQLQVAAVTITLTV